MRSKSAVAAMPPAPSRAIPVKVLTKGAHGYYFTIPRAVMLQYGWQPGQRITMPLDEADAPADLTVRRYGDARQSAFIYVPKALVEHLGWSHGETVHIPFYKWEPAAGPDEKRPPAGRRRT